MKQTQTHVWSLAGEEAVSYSLARGKAAAVTRESGEIAAYSLAPWREQSLALGPCCLPTGVLILSNAYHSATSQICARAPKF